jgi:hypothetical protein
MDKLTTNKAWGRPPLARVGVRYFGRDVVFSFVILSTLTSLNPFVELPGKEIDNHAQNNTFE